MALQGKNAQGFTLIELIAIVVLLAILGVVALSRLSGFGGIESRAFFDDTVNALRYAQKLAVSTGCAVQVSLTAGGYQLLQGDSCTSGAYTRPVLNPVNRAVTYQAVTPAGVSISPAQTIVFTPQAAVTGLGSDIDFTIDGRQFRVYRETGLVDVL